MRKMPFDPEVADVVPADEFLTPYEHGTELPVLEVVSAIHILADLTLGLGKVVHDYLRQPSQQARRINEMALASSPAGRRSGTCQEALCGRMGL
ncbi:hypothetical protein AC630_30645 [Bradyrhizobium sp. AS23.2]|nr:hypothetical protein AC630_30645 [Bradyrhizobium sp. AS23.2]